jgi:hypothetical protein
MEVDTSTTTTTTTATSSSSSLPEKKYKSIDDHFSVRLEDIPSDILTSHVIPFIGEGQYFFYG